MVARVNAILKRTEALPPSPAPTSSAPVAPPERRPGRVIGLFGAKGGVGTTVLTVNLAVALAQMTERVGIIDLDQEHAVANVLLDLTPAKQRTLADLARRPVDEMEWSDVEPYLITHTSGVRLLPGPHSPEQAAVVQVEHIRPWLKLLRAQFLYVLLDLGRSYDETTLEALETCDQVLLVVTPEIAALKTARNAVAVFRHLNIPFSRVRLVLNHPQPGVSLSIGDVRRALELDVAGLVPFGGEEFISWANHGQPIVGSRPRHPTAVVIRQLAEAVISGPTGAEGAKSRLVVNSKS